MEAGLWNEGYCIYPTTDWLSQYQIGFKLDFVEYVRGLCRHHEFEARRAGMLFIYDVQEKDLQNTPPKINMEPKDAGLEDVILFKQVIFRFHVNLPWCNSNIEG